jgi:polo-like kinase 1
MDSDSDSHIENFPDEIEERIYKFNGDEIVKKYTKGKFLGKGGFAKCYELKCLNNKKTYAAKIVSKLNLSKSSAKQKVTQSNIAKIRNKNSQIPIPSKYCQI